jgi:hypothetical protein
VPAQFLGDEFDQVGVADTMPAARSVDLGFGGPPRPAHPQQAVPAGQAVDPVLARVAHRPGHLPQQAVQQRRGGIRVRAPGEAAGGEVGGGVAVGGRGHEIHAIHSFPTVLPDFLDFRAEMISMSVAVIPP